MPLPPSLIFSRTLASFTGLPLASLPCLKRPFSPGPTLVSSLSALWQAEHCSKTSLPLAASPALPLLWACIIPAASNAPAAQPSIQFRIPNPPVEVTQAYHSSAQNAENRFALPVYNGGGRLRDTDGERDYASPDGHRRFFKCSSRSHEMQIPDCYIPSEYRRT